MGAWALVGILCFVAIVLTVWKLRRRRRDQKNAFEIWFYRAAAICLQYDIYPSRDDDVWRSRFRAGLTPEQAVDMEKSWRSYRT